MSSMCAVDVIFEGDRCPLDASKLCMSFFLLLYNWVGPNLYMEHCLLGLTHGSAIKDEI